MASQHDLFWPSLYSRLAPSRYRHGAGPESAVGEEDDDAFGIERHFIGFDALRAQVETELQGLLNATSLEATLIGALLRGGASDALPRDATPFHDHPHIRRSILNYGLPAFIGRNVYSLPLSEIESRLRDAILTYEPRIRADTMRVRVESTGRGDRIAPDKALAFTIEGEIFGPTESLRIAIRTVWDPEKLGTGVESVELER